jgi:hypothetical protein
MLQPASPLVFSGPPAEGADLGWTWHKQFLLPINAYLGPFYSQAQIGAATFYYTPLFAPFLVLAASTAEVSSRFSVSDCNNNTCTSCCVERLFPLTTSIPVAQHGQRIADIPWKVWDRRRQHLWPTRPIQRDRDP